MNKVIVVGAGAAGMMAAYFAAKNKNKVTLIEKNEKTGKKIYITGKGRCNITNACDVEDLFANVMNKKKFLYSAFYGFTNSDVIDFFENHGYSVDSLILPKPNKFNVLVSSLKVQLIFVPNSPFISS